MKYLFIHQNFPGQFRDIAKHLAENSENQVIAMRQHDQGESLPNVIDFQYRFLHQPIENQHPLLEESEAKVLRGEAVAEACRRLEKRGWVPDVVIAHPGWGEALFIKQIWPKVRLVCYFEYFYSLEGQDFNFDPEFIDDSVLTKQKLILKNSVFLHALNDADAGWVPTEWQKQILPEWAHEKVEVIHEGVDLDYFKPNQKASFTIANKGITLKAGDQVVTYAARSLEPVRGFHIFMRALPKILKDNPDVHVVIMGREEACYGPEPKDADSWLEKMLNEVGDQLDPARVHFVGFIDKESYLSVLQVSKVHVYLTYPFVLSWSVMEALACGVRLVASNTKPLHELSNIFNNIIFFEMFEEGNLIEKLNQTLKLSKITLKDEIKNISKLRKPALKKVENYLQSIKNLLA